MGKQQRILIPPLQNFLYSSTHLSQKPENYSTMSFIVPAPAPTLASIPPPLSRHNTKLFSPITIGNMELKHRVIMSPLTRVRCPGGLPTELVKEYYEQRATDGGLIIGEGMHPSFMVGNPSPQLILQGGP
jgi:hypothetical protein